MPLSRPTGVLDALAVALKHIATDRRLGGLLHRVMLAPEGLEHFHLRPPRLAVFEITHDGFRDWR
jgi:hypothetical protein